MERGPAVERPGEARLAKPEPVQPAAHGPLRTDRGADAAGPDPDRGGVVGPGRGGAARRYRQHRWRVWRCHGAAPPARPPLPPAERAGPPGGPGAGARLLSALPPVPRRPAVPDHLARLALALAVHPGGPARTGAPGGGDRRRDRGHPAPGPRGVPAAALPLRQAGLPLRPRGPAPGGSSHPRHARAARRDHRIHGRHLAHGPDLQRAGRRRDGPRPRCRGARVEPPPDRPDARDHGGRRRRPGAPSSPGSCSWPSPS